jgi:GT2 family glycosyltransferase
MRSNSLKFSVIIPTMNRPRDLALALASIYRQSLLPSEVIIIDQSPDALARETVERLRRDHARVPLRLEYLYHGAKSRMTPRNRGILRATGDLLAFLDDDVKLFQDYFEKALVYFEREPQLAAVGGNVMNLQPPEGWKWFCRTTLWRFFLLNNGDGRMTASGFGYPIYERKIDAVIPVQMLQGCTMTVRRGCIPDLMFDEWFTGYGYREDVELSYRIHRAGGKMLMAPDVKLDHYRSPSNRLDLESLRRMQVRNYHYVFKKFKRRGLLSKALFGYSLAGTLLIDVIEWLSNRSPQKASKLRGGLSGFREVMRGR